MNKQEFLARLQEGISGLPQEDIAERVAFYREMIDDRVEEGLSEEEAISEIGSVEDLISQIIADTPLTKLVKEKIKEKRTLQVWEIVLLILGAPIWLSILVAVIAIILSIYISIWAIIISLWAVWGTLIVCAVGVLLASVVFFVQGYGASGVAMIGAGIVCAGLSIFMFYGCKYATKGLVVLTKKVALGIKNCFVKKGEA